MGITLIYTNQLTPSPITLLHQSPPHQSTAYKSQGSLQSLKRTSRTRHRRAGGDRFGIGRGQG